jgi:D-alanine-D-alanine ligase
MAENKRLRVGVIFGGRSGEHEVSLVSAASVIRALDPEKYEALPIGIAKDGRWFIGTPAQKMLPDVLRQGQRVMLSADPNVGALMPLEPSSAGSQRVDVIFPVLHGTYGEDGTVQGLLDLAGLPYVGSGVIGSAVGMDKNMQKRLFLQAGLPVGEFQAILRSDWESGRERVLKAVAKKFRFPLFVKPATLAPRWA